MERYIDSIHNKIIKEAASLQSKRERDKRGLFALEGERLIGEIPDSLEIKYIITSESYTGKVRSNAIIYVTSDEIFKKLSDTVNPQGILAVCSVNEGNTDFKIKSNRLYILLENVMDPGNMGTIIRTADAAGADGIFLSKGCVDIYNPKVLRSTMGSVFHLPIYKNIDLAALINKMNSMGIPTLAAHLKASGTPYAVNMRDGCAIIIGNEANGLTDDISCLASNPVKIPMLGKAESMNAAVAAAIMIYEAVRQKLDA